MNDYNLLEEKWIPVLYRDGSVDRVGILKALEDANRIREIAASNPMDRIAILRFLLALLYWCEGNPNTPPDSALSRQCFSKLNESKGCFDLLGPDRPLYQDSTLTHEVRGSAEAAKEKEMSKSKGKLSCEELSRRIEEKVRDSFVAATNLMHDLPSATNIAHFRHVQDGRDGLCLSCCAIGLLRWSVAAGAGTAGAGKSMTAGVNGVTPTYSIPTGVSLGATLLLAWPRNGSMQHDIAIWDGATENSALGFLKGMTWRSRRILLAPPDLEGKRDLSSGRCCHCGEQTDRLVKSILFRPGWERPSKEPWSDDPHLLRIIRKDGNSAKAKEKKIVPSWPGPNDPLEDHAGVWRSVMEGLLQRSAGSQCGATEFRTTLLGASQALYKHVGEHRAVLPELASDVAHSLLAELEWLRDVTWVTVAARGGNWRDPPKGHRVVGALCAPGAKGCAIRSSLCARSFQVEGELQKAFEKLMERLATTDEAGGEPIVRDWKAEVCRILRSYAEPSVTAAKSGSPLPRREARQGASDAILDAIRQSYRKKGVSK